MESSTKFILHERLVQLRTERGWSQYDLEEKLYLTQKAISNIEKGNCTLSNLIQLANLYDVSLDYLIGRSSERRYNTLGMDALKVYMARLSFSYSQALDFTNKSLKKSSGLIPLTSGG